MITEDYVSFATAQLLKEKGFDGEDTEDCFAFYKENGEIGFLQTFGDIADYYNSENPVIAPTLQMAMKWLRILHKIDIDILSRLSLNADDDHCYSYVIKHQYDKYAFKTYTDGEYQYFEDAVEAALIYCLENLI